MPTDFVPLYLPRADKVGDFFGNGSFGAKHKKSGLVCQENLDRKMLGVEDDICRA